MGKYLVLALCTVLLVSTGEAQEPDAAPSVGQAATQKEPETRSPETQKRGAAKPGTATKPGTDGKAQSKPKVGAPTTRDAKKPDPNEPSPKNTESPTEIPYPMGEWVEYHWFKDGERVGTSHVRFDKTEARPGQVQLSRTFDFRVPGRYVHMEDESDLDEQMHPLKVSEEHSLAAGEMKGATTVDSKFEHGIALVTFKTLEGAIKDPRTHEIDLDTPIYLFPKYSFLAETSMVFHAGGDGRYALFCPYEARVYDVDVKRLRSEIHGGRKLWRWKIEHRTFNAEFWVTVEGALEKYRQETSGIVTEVQRAR